MIGEATSHPRVSVVVPTLNRPTLLEACLNALLGQDLDGGGGAWEIIVVDDAPSGAGQDERLPRDGVANLDVIAQAQRRAGPAGPVIRYLLNTGRHGPAAARNLGWRSARGEIIAFTDDDCRPEPDWLEHGLTAFVDGVQGVSGRVVVPLPPRPSDYELNSGHLATSEFVTANCFYRRGALESAGGFDERFPVAWREDSDLFFALMERGSRLVHEPKAVVVHPIREVPWGISLRQQRKTAYNALLRSKHPTLYRTRIQRSPLSYYPLVGALMLTLLLGSGRRWRAAAGTAAAWIGGTMVFAASRLRHTRRDPSHVAEMVVTSALIPPLSIFWRVIGMLKFGRIRP